MDFSFSLGGYIGYLLNIVLLVVLFFRYGHFSGINRKVQLTYLPHGCPKTSSEEEGISLLMPIVF